MKMPKAKPFRARISYASAFILEIESDTHHRITLNKQVHLILPRSC